MTQPNDTLRKTLIAKLRKGYLLIIGVLIVIALGFTFQDGIGSMFKGLIAGPGDLSGVGNSAGSTGVDPGVTVGVAPSTPSIPNYNFPPMKVKTTPMLMAISNLPITAGSATIEFDEDDLIFTKTTQTTPTVKIDSTIVPNPNPNLYNDTPGMSYASKTLTIPYKTLEYGKTYVVAVPREAIKTIQGTLLEAVDATWKFNTAPAPQNTVTCTQNTMRSEGAEICQSNEWLKCEGTLPLSKKITADGQKECTNTNNVWKWTDVTPQPPPNNGNNGNNGNQGNNSSDSCSTENETKNSGSYICKNGIWLRCNASREGQRSTDNTKICKDSEWIPVPTTQNSNIKISKASVFPIGFNPLLAETKITYKISAKAKMEIKIIDGTGVKIRGLITDETIDAGEYKVTWDGAGDEGEVVDPGEYSFKITAKNPTSGEIADVKSGTINVVYYQAARDFEDQNTSRNGNATNSSQSPATVQPLQPSVPEANATMALQNATSGTTTPTGPEVLIYLAFPVLGYFLGRKK